MNSIILLLVLIMFKGRVLHQAEYSKTGHNLKLCDEQFSDFESSFNMQLEETHNHHRLMHITTEHKQPRVWSISSLGGVVFSINIMDLSYLLKSFASRNENDHKHVYAIKVKGGFQLRSSIDKPDYSYYLYTPINESVELIK